jgi:hypothetical protein
MLRQIIKPTSEFYNVHIPKEYINHEVEIVLLPLFMLENSNNTQAPKKEFNPQEFYSATTASKDEIDEYLSNNKSEWE